MGAALFIVFTQLYTGIPLGRPAQILGHVTFTLSFVVVIVRGRLVAIGPVYEEAARDLGANARQALRLVILPAAVAGDLRQRRDRVRHVASTTSSSPRSCPPARGPRRCPIRIYSSARGGATPALNAVATLMLLITMGVIGARPARPQPGPQAPRRQGEADALGDLAGMSV